MFDKMGYLVKSNAGIGNHSAISVAEVLMGRARHPHGHPVGHLDGADRLHPKREWIAVQASGFETKHFWKPLLWCAGRDGIQLHGPGDGPARGGRRSRHLWREYIHPEWEWISTRISPLIGKPGQFIQARLYLKDGRMERPPGAHLGEGRGKPA